MRLIAPVLLGRVLWTNDQDVMDHRAVARARLGGLDPLSSVKSVGTRKCWYGTVPAPAPRTARGARRPASGVPMLQPSGNDRAPGRRLGSPRGHALVDPGQDRGPLPASQAAVVLEVAVTRVGVPGGHAAVVDHLADHAWPRRRASS